MASHHCVGNPCWICHPEYALSLDDASLVCEHDYYKSKCPKCPRLCHRCLDTGFAHCGDNNTGVSYSCEEFGPCSWLNAKKND